LRGAKALAVGVAGGVGQVADHVLLISSGGIEAERGQVADVQLDDLLALVLHLAGLVQHRPADVVTDVGKLAGLGNRFQTAISCNGPEPTCPKVGETYN
jgi:hypothetical protein